MSDLERRTREGDQTEERLALSEGVRRALYIAIQEANVFGQPYIETPDVLVGLVAVEPTKTVLERAGVNVEKIGEIRRSLGGYSGPINASGAFAITSGSIERVGLTVPFRTHRMQKIGALAEIRAKKNNRVLVEPEDLLTVLLEEDQSMAANILSAMGVDKKSLLESINGDIIET